MTPDDRRQRRHVLLLMLTALRWQYPTAAEPAMVAGLHSWLDCWLGLGRVTFGLACQGYDLQLMRYDGEGWRATFFSEGRAHSLTAAVGSAWEREPWIAVQQARWESLRKRAAEEA